MGESLCSRDHCTTEINWKKVLSTKAVTQMSIPHIPQRRSPCALLSCSATRSISEAYKESHQDAVPGYVILTMGLLLHMLLHGWCRCLVDPRSCIVEHKRRLTSMNMQCNKFQLNIAIGSSKARAHNAGSIPKHVFECREAHLSHRTRFVHAPKRDMQNK